MTYSIANVQKPCFTQNSDSSIEGQLVLIYSANDDISFPLVMGKTTQKLICNLSRSTTLSYTFSSINLATMVVDDQTTTGTIEMKRMTDDFGAYFDPNAPKIATSGENVFFEISDGTDTYYLAKLYEDYCVENFLDSSLQRIVNNT